MPAESGEMGVLANHVPSIEQLKPGLIEIVEESGSSKQFFRTFPLNSNEKPTIEESGSLHNTILQSLVDLPLFSPTPL